MLIKKIDKQTAEVRLYGNIGSWFANGDSFTQMLEDCEAKGYKDLIIRMHCYGGSVFEGNVIYNALQRSSLNIKILIDGVAASMGLYVLPAIADVYIAENGFGMAHRPSAPGEGDADAHLAVAKLLKDMEDNFLRVLTERTDLSSDDIKAKWLNGKDHWLNADEMVKYGFAKGKLPATAKNIKILDNEITQGLSVEAMYDRFAACFDYDNNKNDNQMKEELIAALGLQGVTANSTDAEIVAAAKKQKEEQKAALEKLEAEAKTNVQASVKTLLDGAKIPEGDLRKTYEGVGLAQGVEVLATILGAKAPAAPSIPLANYVQGGPKATLEQPIIQTITQPGATAVVQDWNWYQTNAPQALVQMEKEQPEQFKALYKAEYGVDLE